VNPVASCRVDRTLFAGLPQPKPKTCPLPFCHTFAVGYRLGVLEDENLTRLTLITALKSLGHEVVTASSLASEFLSAASISLLDAVILDLHLGTGPTGIDVARELLVTRPELGIVFLTSFEDPRLLDPSVGELPEGSVYLVKNEIANIEVLDGAIAAAVAKLGKLPSANVVQVLSDTQVETLRLVAKGLSNAEIAKQRFITEKSVEVTISRIAKTLGIANEPNQNQRVHMAKVYFRSRGISVE
jgi:two-component system, NarL family, nitrate/nitrite response regulator NarL